MVSLLSGGYIRNSISPHLHLPTPRPNFCFPFTRPLSPLLPLRVFSVPVFPVGLRREILSCVLAWFPAGTASRGPPQKWEGGAEQSDRRGEDKEKKMCPMRIILIFLSATLAGYFAWKTVRSPASSPLGEDEDREPEKAQSFDLRKVIGNGFWVFVDMASGKYLWRNLRGLALEATEGKER